MGNNGPGGGDNPYVYGEGQIRVKEYYSIPPAVIINTLPPAPPVAIQAGGSAAAPAQAAPIGLGEWRPPPSEPPAPPAPPAPPIIAVSASHAARWLGPTITPEKSPQPWCGLFSDVFNDSSINSRFTAQPTGAAWVEVATIRPSALVFGKAGLEFRCYQNTDAGAAFKAAHSTNTGRGVYVRGTWSAAGAFSGYVVMYDDVFAAAWVLRRYDADSPTELDSGFMSPGDGDVVEIRAVGDTISVYLNDAFVVSAIDATYATGRTGLIGFNTTAAGAFTYFRHQHLS